MGTRSYRAIRVEADSDGPRDRPCEVEVVTVASENFNLTMPLQLAAEYWVPPLADGMINFASEDRGARVSVSSNMWGIGTGGNERLMNVLRHGDLHGTPRFLCGNSDNSFIFHDNDDFQWMLIDIGARVCLRRVGTAYYGDRCFRNIRVWTSTELLDGTFPVAFGTASSHDEVEARCRAAASRRSTMAELDASLPALGGEKVYWGEKKDSFSTRLLSHDGSVHFDRPPTEARYILMLVSGDYDYPTGSRMGPVFAWGHALWWSPENHKNFPPAFRGLVKHILLQRVRRANGAGQDAEPSLTDLPVDLWRQILSHCKSSDWP